jgi:signal transduction histidine kinase
VIQRATERLANLTNELLEFAAPQPLQLAPIKPKDLLEEAAATFRAEHTAAAPRIVLAPTPELPPLRVDRHRMIQTLVNLMDNAVKHARGVTTVTLSAGCVTDGPSAHETPSQMSIRVANDGAGIAPEDLPHIFDPFFTTGGGTGLGLAIVQQIVTGHGGTITVESQPGSGTVFTIYLPTEHTENTKGEK